ncbi:MAG: sporulation protein [Clostridia bacterium]|nr:sporulation protein [Clostridia bacterium]
MSIFHKAIASAGFGSAKVETHLDTQKICKGQQATGFISILGGKTKQKASKVSLILMTYMDIEEDNYENRKTIELSKLDIVQNIQIKPNDTLEIPFSFVLPNDTPISLRDNTIWIETSLDIKMAIDPSNKNYVQVLPHPFMQRILDILQKNLKFVLTKHGNIYVPNNGVHLPIVQIFEFNPTSQFIENLDEVKMIFFPDDLRGLEIVMQFPQKTLGSQQHIHKASFINDSNARIFIPKKEFEKDNSSLADLLLHSIRSQLG